MVSIVILNYNDAELTAAYAKRMAVMDCIDCVVIVDNCSPDGSFEKLKAFDDGKIHVLKTDRNAGYASGNNFGLKYISRTFGEDGIAIISNPDIETDETAVSTIIEAMEADESIFAATGLIYNVRDELSPIFTWHLPTMAKLLANCSVLIRNMLYKLFGWGTRLKEGEFDFDAEKVNCEALPGCFFAARMKELMALGGFCEDTFLFYEEDILFSKAAKRGLKSVILPKAHIRHLEGVSVKKSLNSWKKREKLMEESCRVYMRVALNEGRFACAAYSIINRLLLPERYLFYRLKRVK